MTNNNDDQLAFVVRFRVLLTRGLRFFSLNQEDARKLGSPLVKGSLGGLNALASRLPQQKGRKRE